MGKSEKITNLQQCLEYGVEYSNNDNREQTEFDNRLAKNYNFNCNFNFNPL